MALPADQLGNAVYAYVLQTFGEDQVNKGYFVNALSTGLFLDWLRDDPEPTAEQLEDAWHKWNWDEVRVKRNALLAKTDWHANTDVTMSDDMKNYRQALRDLPASTADALDVVWPEAPE